MSYKDEYSIPLVNEDITLYAQWKEKSYIVSFSANGGRGSLSPITVASGKKLKLPTNSFTFDDYFFVCWNTEANGDGISYKNEEEISVTANITLYAQWRLPKGMSNGYEWVDLGLSSGTKWATMNVGATYPEDFGDFFAWGETETKTVYDWSTYKWCDGSVNRINKYSRNSDGLELQDDAAFVNWGGNWRTPTSEELDELRNECTWIWTTQNGVDGYKIQSKINANSIFLPAAGFYSATDGKVYYSNIYWSRTPSREYQEYAYILTILSNKIDLGSVSRCCGVPVRAVLP
ncbi:MAG: InlB B-repeat-containing protein [Paludibacteraceae bacterium]|nr:InlB B-repeat-containing protein [Paludibacteraceae bacterium]